MTATYRSAQPITPHDVTPLPKVARAIYVGMAGNITVLLAQDTVPVTFIAVPAGTTLSIMTTQVLATGTTASALVLLR